jgi:hypothetical protein
MAPVGNGEGSDRRSNFEATATLLNRRDGMAPAAHSGCPDDRMMRIDNPADESCFPS